jgi:hypothetical protein
MLTVRGTFDGKIFKALPGEPVPSVRREVPVAIIFLENVAVEARRRLRQVEIARRMRAARVAMEPLGVSVKDLVEAGRER